MRRTAGARWMRTVFGPHNSQCTWRDKECERKERERSSHAIHASTTNDRVSCLFQPVPAYANTLNSVLQWFVCSTHESATKNKRNKSNSTKAMKNGAKQIENRRTSDKVIRRETHTFGTFNQLNEADYVLLWPLCNRQNDLSHQRCVCVWFMEFRAVVAVCRQTNRLRNACLAFILCKITFSGIYTRLLLPSI